MPHKALEGIFFYPAEFQARAVEKGLVSQEYIDKRKKLFMAPFMLAILAALILIIGLWNGVREFGTAYWQAVLFLEVVNWFDGIVIDELWVGHSKFWIIPGMEGESYVKPWSFNAEKTRPRLDSMAGNCGAGCGDCGADILKGRDCL